MYKNLKTKANFEERKKAVEDFNHHNRWRKRGICALGEKYGVHRGYAEGTSAFINVGEDGSVIVYHAACEIGQGVHDKVATSVSVTLGCPFEKIRISDTNSDITPGSFTGGSVGSEAAAEAARLAAIEIKERIQPFKLKLWAKTPDKEPTWEQVVAEAKHNSVLLTSTGHFKPLGQAKDDERSVPWQHHFSDYHTWGAVVSEVEVDILTGEFIILRSDVYYDVGNSLNPLIDAGQAEGAFVFGIGYFLQEEELVSPDGKTVSNNTWTYKPPLAVNIPLDFRVEFLKDSNFPKGVFGCKAVGEPPMILAYSVMSALKQAIRASRVERGLPAYVQMDGPFTIDRRAVAAAVSSEHLKL